MTTPNGQQPSESNGASEQATSTVLALDGWGPVIAEPMTNGTNGSEPEIAAEAPQPMEPPQAAGTDWRQAVLRSVPVPARLPRPTLDTQLIRVLAPAAAMTITILVAMKLGGDWRSLRVQALTPQPRPQAQSPSRILTLRRRIALTIDPSLTPVEPAGPRILSWIRQQGF